MDKTTIVRGVGTGNGTSGSFLAHIPHTPETSVALTSAIDFSKPGNGMQSTGVQGGVTVSEIRSQDRERDYRIMLADRGAVTVCIVDSGLYRENDELTDDGDEIRIRRAGTKLVVDFVSAGRDYSGLSPEFLTERAEAMSDRMDGVVRRAIPGAAFDSAETSLNWSNLGLEYRLPADIATSVDNDGVMHVTASEIMRALEKDPAYVQLRDGSIHDAVCRSMSEYWVE
jgi:hypothetical protein